MDWEAVSAELRKPLDKAHVQPPSQYGPKGEYIEAWFAQAEANRIFGFGGWSQEVTHTNCVTQAERPIGKNGDPGWGVTYTAMVRVTVSGVVREDFGAGHGYDRDLGLAHESAIKEAVSDASKRALKSFGNPFGLALYDKTKANVVDVAAEAAKEEAKAKWKATAQARADEIIGQMRTCETLEELGGLWAELAEHEREIAKRQDVKAAKEDMKAALSGDDPALKVAAG